MWRYKTGEFVHEGDLVEVSKTYQSRFGHTRAKVVGRSGFVTIQFDDGVRVDTDMRSIRFISRR